MRSTKRRGRTKEIYTSLILGMVVVCVGLPLAFAVRAVLDGSVQARGVCGPGSDRAVWGSVLSELQRRGHAVSAFEPDGNWSLGNLLKDGGEAGLEAFRTAYPDLDATVYRPDADLAAQTQILHS